MKKGVYVLGTGLSHDGSACLLKDGRICVAIEKERITRKKHDGYNDTDSITYCLKAEGITLDDLDLIVQSALFGNFKMGNDYYFGPRLLHDKLNVPVVTISHHLAHAYSTIGTCPFEECNILVIDGTGSPFDECYDLADSVIPDLERIKIVPHVYWEKDSYYGFANNRCRTIYKDFSEQAHHREAYMIHPLSTKHSIGALYAAVSRYCFTNVDDVGKLMGLGPYGRPGVFNDEIFDLRDGRIFVNHDWMYQFRKPARTYAEFKKDFQYYADIAYWVQKEVERAVIYVINSRMEMAPSDNLCFAGGVALNAVANAKIFSDTRVKNLYIEPAAGDNGLAIGCAYYGWMEVLKKEKVPHGGSTCFGITYPTNTIARSINAYKKSIDLFFELLMRNYSARTPSNPERRIRFDISGVDRPYNVTVKSTGFLEVDNLQGPRQSCLVSLDKTSFLQLIFKPDMAQEILRSNRVAISNPADLEVLLKMANVEAMSKLLIKDIGHEVTNGNGATPPTDPDYIQRTARLLAEGKIVGWFQDGSEFGPRALGRRSILADPRNTEARRFINSEIKFREDFRPFAPSVLREDVMKFFQNDRESPYMILVDQVRSEWKDKLRSIVHEDGSCRIQTVTEDWNPKFYRLLQEFKKLTGISVLLNTSFNRKGMPIVETPDEALQFFYSSKLDCLTIHDYVVEK